MNEPRAPHFRPDELEAFTARVFEAEGMPQADARCVARTLVFGNLRGLDTHGVGRIPAYLKRIRAGQINLAPKIGATSTMPFATVVDGDNAMGPVVAQACIDACLASVERLGIGVATARRSNHFGAASAYTVPLTARGCIAMAMAPGAKSLAPHGSRAPLLGTNPLAVAAPAGRHAPWSLDMAASVAARGHVRMAAQAGRSIPEGWALDAAGAPTTDPEAALRGVMLPFGGAKGSALSMMVDVLAGVLAGAGFAGTTRDWNLDFDGPADVGHFFLVMKVEAFLPLAEFEARMETAIARLKALRPAEGFDEVLYPGERAGRTQTARLRDGIALSAPALKALRALAREQGIALPDPS
jgi:L-2-hydroxycarboxylate dehydrogenase (NAD+)